MGLGPPPPPCAANLIGAYRRHGGIPSRVVRPSIGLRSSAKAPSWLEYGHVGISSWREFAIVTTRHGSPISPPCVTPATLTFEREALRRHRERPCPRLDFVV